MSECATALLERSEDLFAGNSGSNLIKVPVTGRFGRCLHVKNVNVSDGTSVLPDVAALRSKAVYGRRFHRPQDGLRVISTGRANSSKIMQDCAVHSSLR